MSKSKRIWLIVLALVLQSAVLGAICIQREAIVQSGQTVYLRTLPVDPRDMFRGDYVRLNYEVSTLPADLAANWVVAERMQKPAQRVYLSFHTDARQRLVPDAIGLKRPDQGPFIRGYTRREYRKNKISIKFGLEKYFVQQGQGLPLERGQRLQGVSLPLEMAVGVGESSGIAVLKGHRYAKLGMGVTLPKPVKAPALPKSVITVKLVNASETPLQIVDPPDHGTFAIELESQSWRGPEARQLAFRQPLTAQGPFHLKDTRVLAPGQAYEVRIDLQLPRYQLMRGNQPIAWHEMDYGETARIVYRPPTNDQIEGLDTAIELWQGHIASRPISGRRFIR